MNKSRTLAKTGISEREHGEEWVDSTAKEDGLQEEVRQAKKTAIEEKA